jgi:hypothetical protein
MAALGSNLGIQRFSRRVINLGDEQLPYRLQRGCNPHRLLRAIGVARALEVSLRRIKCETSMFHAVPSGSLRQ